MHHDPYGWWIAEAGAGPTLPRLEEDARADVVIVGGGYLGMWSAWHLLERDPSLSVVLLERARCGFGPSGRNGGFANPYWDKLGSLVAKFGERDGLALARAAAASVQALGTWADAHGHDIWFRAAPEVDVATAPAQVGGWTDAVAEAERRAPGTYVALTQEQRAARVSVPALVGGGALLSGSATLQPARLAFALRDELLARGVRVHESTRVVDVGAGRVQTAGGVRVEARAVILAVNHRAAALRRYARRLSVASSHIVLTRPVPDLLAAAGWTGGEGLADGRTMLHYFRTTPDGRIAFGWGGGRMGLGGRDSTRLSVDVEVVARTREHLLRVFDGLTEADVTHAWGGPIDVSPTRLPQYVSDGPVFAGFGFTGNGVAPAWLGGRILSGLALDVRDDVTALPLVDRDVPRFPPEPLRYVGGSIIRNAMVRLDDAHDAGAEPGAVTRLVAGVPRRLGLSLPR